MTKNSKAFTLTEILVVIVVAAVGMGIFYVLFTNNWFAYEERITRNNLLSEANQVIDRITFVARNSQTVSSATSEETQTLTFTNQVGTVTGIFKIYSDGRISVTSNNVEQFLSSFIDTTQTRFATSGSLLTVTLTLKDYIWMHTVTVTTTSEILLRGG